MMPSHKWSLSFFFFVKPKNGVRCWTIWWWQKRAPTQKFSTFDGLQIRWEFSQCAHNRAFLCQIGRYRKAKIPIRSDFSDQAKWRYGHQNHSDIHKQTVNLLRSGGGIAAAAEEVLTLSLTSWKIQCCAKRAMDGGHQNFNLIFHTAWRTSEGKKEDDYHHVLFVLWRKTPPFKGAVRLFICFLTMMPLKFVLQ